MSDKNKANEKLQHDDYPSTSRGARRNYPKSKGNKVDGDVYYTPNPSEECFNCGIMPDPKVSVVGARKPPSGKVVSLSLKSERDVLQARHTDTSFKSIISDTVLPERKRTSKKRLSSIPEQAEPPTEDEETLRPSEVSRKSDELNYREVAEQLLKGDQKKKRILKDKYREKKRLVAPPSSPYAASTDGTKSIHSLQNRIINYEGPLEEEARSLHSLHVNPEEVKVIVTNSSSSELSDNESLIWATTYAKKPGEFGSDESAEWKSFKRVMKGHSDDTSSSTGSEEKVIVEQKIDQPDSVSPIDAPAVETWAQRLKINLLEFLQRWTSKRNSSDDAPKDAEQPSTSHGMVVVKGKRIGDDVFFSPRESEASFYSLMSVRSRRSHRFSRRRTVTSFRSALSDSDMTLSRDPSFQSSLFSQIADSKQPRPTDANLVDEKTEDDAEQPAVVRPIEPMQPTETAERPTIVKKHHKGKIPKNLAHIEDLHEKMPTGDPLTGDLSVQTGENVAARDDQAASSSSSSLKSESESFLWSGKYAKRIQKVVSVDSQIQEWVTFKKTPKKVTNYDDDYDSDELDDLDELFEPQAVSTKERSKSQADQDEVKRQQEMEERVQGARPGVEVDDQSSPHDVTKISEEARRKNEEETGKPMTSEKKIKDQTGQKPTQEDPTKTVPPEPYSKRRTIKHFKRDAEEHRLEQDTNSAQEARRNEGAEKETTNAKPDEVQTKTVEPDKDGGVAGAEKGIPMDQNAERPTRDKSIKSERSSKPRTATHFKRGIEVPPPQTTHITFDPVAATESSHSHSQRLDPEQLRLRRSHETPRLSTIRDGEGHEVAQQQPLVTEHDVQGKDIEEVVVANDDIYTGKDLEVNRGSQLSLLKRSHEAPRMSTIRNEFVPDRQNEEHQDKGDDEQADQNIPEKPQRIQQHKTQHLGSSSSSSYDEMKAQLKAMHSKLQTNLIMGNAFIYMILPPDGGFGWIIMFISFLCQIIVDGIIFGIGLLLPDMARDLGVDSQTITLVASMQIGCYFLGASFASALINRHGFRPVAFFGAVASVITIILSTFSPNLTTLIILYSIIGGPTLSMIWVSSQLIIGYYFERNRPVANGISCSGAGAGIVIFCAMNSFLVPEIGWRNTSRVHAMILSSVLLLCMTYVEVKPTRVGQVKELEPETESDHSSSEEYDYRRTYRYSKSFSIRQSIQSTHEQNLNDMLEVYVEPAEERHGLCRRLCGDCCGGTRPKAIDADVESNMARGYVIRHDPIERQDLFYTGPADYERYEVDGNEILDNKQVELLRGTEHSIKNVNYTLSMMHAAREPPAKRRTYQQLKARNVPNPLLAFLKPSNLIHPKVQSALRKLFDYRLLSIMEFRVLCASAFLFPMGFNIPFVYSKLRAEVDPFHASFISPAIGASGFVFRILSGFLAQRYRSWTTYLCGGGMFFGGFFVFVSAFYGQDQIWFQYLYGASYGVAPAVYSTLRAIIYVRSLGLDKLTNAFGMTALAMGCGVFVGTTLAGIMNQQTGSYTASFAFGGICIMMAGTLKLILPSLMQWKEERDARNRRVTFM